MNPAASFPSPIGNSFPSPFGTGFPQTPPTAAWTPPPADYAIQRHQQEIYIAGLRYVEWLKVIYANHFDSK